MKIEPALTAEEWGHPEHRVERNGDWIYEPPILTCPVVGSLNSGVALGDIRHAAAALCLYGQPFGFTREDIKVIRDAARDLTTGIEDASQVRFAERHAAELNEIADRLESLLPPEKA